MIINGISNNGYSNIKFSGTSNAVSAGIDTFSKRTKLLMPKVGYSALGLAVAGTLGYLVLKPENEAVKHASRYVPNK